MGRMGRCKTLQTGKTMFQALQVLLMVQHCARLFMDRMQFLDVWLQSSGRFPSLGLPQANHNVHIERC